MLTDRIANGTARIGVIGLGYVGLPLAAEFGKIFPVTGFDLKPDRIASLRKGIDRTLETSRETLEAAKKLSFTGDPEALRGCDFYLVTVPTPVDRHNAPDLTPLVKASETVGSVIGKGAIVIYESTVYPGCTEEQCVPLIEQRSGLRFNTDFFAGYSPERINPGDKEHTLTKIRKITSGSTPEAAKAVDALYASVITAGTFPVSSIKVAEAAKVIENSQRDINIAFVNELSKIFHLLKIDTGEVLEAAGTKWNFLPFKPGFVGGHCIGVDPYYLTFKAQECGYHPEIILAGRRLNDGMGNYVASEVIKLMIRKDNPIRNAKILILGLTFKENCTDLRNTRVVDLYHSLLEFGCMVDVYDPWPAPGDAEKFYGIKLIQRETDLDKSSYSAVIAAVAHQQFLSMDFSEFNKPGRVIFDVKGFIPKDVRDGSL